MSAKVVFAVRMEGRMAAEAIVLWLCGAGALSGLLMRLISEMHSAGIF
jgi:hypothetical protein